MLTCLWDSWPSIYFGPFVHIGVSEALDRRTQGKESVNKKGI
jgi:hypothetical protein